MCLPETRQEVYKTFNNEGNIMCEKRGTLKNVMFSFMDYWKKILFL